MKLFIPFSSISIILLLSIIYLSCSKDSNSVSNITSPCANGRGYMSNGVCVCITGYSGPNCDPLLPTIVFYNHSVCRVHIKQISTGIVYDSLLSYDSVSFTGVAGSLDSFQVNTTGNLVLGATYSWTSSSLTPNLVLSYPASGLTPIILNISSDSFALFVNNHTSYTFDKFYFNWDLSPSNPLRQCKILSSSIQPYTNQNHLGVFSYTLVNPSDAYNLYTIDISNFQPETTNIDLLNMINRQKIWDLL